MTDVSTIILTRDEEGSVENTIRSVQWCDETIIVDSESVDRTRQIAAAYDSTIVDAPRPDIAKPFDQFRRLGVEAASNDLLLLLDADETLPRDLQDYLQAFLAEYSGEVLVVRAPVLNYVGNELLVRGWPRYKPLVVRRDSVAFAADVHDFLRIDGMPADELPTVEVHDVPAVHELAVHHHLADSLYERWMSQRRYARIAGGQRPFSPTRLILGPPWGLYHRLIEHGGWRDGLLGVGLALCYSWFLFETQVRAGIRTVFD